MSLPKKRIRVMRLIARMNVGGPAIQITGLMSNLDSEDFEQKLITGFCDTSEVDYLEVSNKSLPRVKPGNSFAAAAMRFKPNASDEVSSRLRSKRLLRPTKM